MHNFFFHHTQSFIILSSKYPNSLNVFKMILMLVLFIQSTSEIARVQEDTTGIDLSNFKHHSSHFSLVVSKFANLLLWMRGIIIHTQAWNWISEITILCFISRVCYGELPSKVWDVQNVESNVMINAKIYSTPIVFNVSFTKYFIIINVRIMYSLEWDLV